MPKDLKNQEDENLEHAFYSDLDKKTEKKSCCSCYTLAILFIIAAIIVVLLALYLLKTFRGKEITPNFSNVNAGELIGNKLNQIKDEPTLKLAISSSELTALLDAGVNSFNLELQEPKVDITDSEIIISGKQKQFFSSTIVINVLPVVKNEKVYLRVIKVKSWNLPMPGMLSAGFEKTLNNILDKRLQDVYDKYKVTDIQLEEGQMTIFGKIK